MTSAIDIVRATSLDLPILECLHRAAFADAPSAQPHEHWDESFLARLLVGPGVDGWIASIGDEPVGFALGRTAAGEAEILTLGVRPDRRGAGVGKALVCQLVQGCRSAGASILFLEVACDNAAALALYRGAGFRDVGTRKAYYRRDPEPVDAIVMRLDLD